MVKIHVLRLLLQRYQAQDPTHKEWGYDCYSCGAHNIWTAFKSKRHSEWPDNFFI